MLLGVLVFVVLPATPAEALTLSGTVYGPDGPVSGAEILIDGDDGPVEETTSDGSGRFALESESAGFSASKTQERLLYDLPEDFWSTYRVEIDKLTPEQLLAVGEGVMDRGNLQLIAVGKSKALARKLEGFGEVRVYNSDLELVED